MSRTKRWVGAALLLCCFFEADAQAKSDEIFFIAADRREVRKDVRGATNEQPQTLGANAKNKMYSDVVYRTADKNLQRIKKRTEEEDKRLRIISISADKADRYFADVEIPDFMAIANEDYVITKQRRRRDALWMQNPVAAAWYKLQEAFDWSYFFSKSREEFFMAFTNQPNVVSGKNPLSGDLEWTRRYKLLTYSWTTDGADNKAYNLNTPNGVQRSSTKITYRGETLHLIEEGNTYLPGDWHRIDTHHFLLRWGFRTYAVTRRGFLELAVIHNNNVIQKLQADGREAGLQNSQKILTEPFDEMFKKMMEDIPQTINKVKVLLHKRWWLISSTKHEFEPTSLVSLPDLIWQNNHFKKYKVLEISRMIEGEREFEDNTRVLRFHRRNGGDYYYTQTLRPEILRFKRKIDIPEYRRKTFVTVEEKMRWIKKYKIYVPICLGDKEKLLTPHEVVLALRDAFESPLWWSATYPQETRFSPFRHTISWYWRKKFDGTNLWRIPEKYEKPSFPLDCVLEYSEDTYDVKVMLKRYVVIFINFEQPLKLRIGKQQWKEARELLDKPFVAVYTHDGTNIAKEMPDVTISLMTGGESPVITPDPFSTGCEPKNNLFTTVQFEVIVCNGWSKIGGLVKRCINDKKGCKDGNEWSFKKIRSKATGINFSPLRPRQDKGTAPDIFPAAVAPVREQKLTHQLRSTYRSERGPEWWIYFLLIPAILAILVGVALWIRRRRRLRLSPTAAGPVMNEEQRIRAIMNRNASAEPRGGGGYGDGYGRDYRDDDYGGYQDSFAQEADQGSMPPWLASRMEKAQGGTGSKLPLKSALKERSPQGPGWEALASATSRGLPEGNERDSYRDPARDEQIDELLHSRASAGASTASEGPPTDTEYELGPGQRNDPRLGMDPRMNGSSRRDNYDPRYDSVYDRASGTIFPLESGSMYPRSSQATHPSGRGRGRGRGRGGVSPRGSRSNFPGDWDMGSMSSAGGLAASSAGGSKAAASRRGRGRGRGRGRRSVRARSMRRGSMSRNPSVSSIGSSASSRIPMSSRRGSSAPGKRSKGRGRGSRRNPSVSSIGSSASSRIPMSSRQGSGAPKKSMKGRGRGRGRGSRKR